MKNKQNLFQRLLAVMMLVLVMAFSTQTTAKAGFGDFNDYDSSSDWDSSDSWDSDWGSSDYDSYDYDYDDDGGSGEFSPIAIVIGLIIVVYSIIESTRKKNKKTSGTATQRAPQHRAPAPAPADQTEAISQQIKAKDPLFTAQDFLAFDYQVKEATGEILFGDKTTRWNMQYKMTFMRSVGSLTKDAKDKEKGLVCPNCGAPLTGTSFGKCEYCGSIVTTGAYDWVLSAFTAIK